METMREMPLQKDGPSSIGDLWVISFIGKDRPGLIRDILEEPADKGVNIVDMDQRVMQGIFVMSLVADFSSARISPQDLEIWFGNSAASLGL